MQNRQEPILQALILADQVYTDAGTGKRIVCGTFDNFWMEEFPNRYPVPTVAYIVLTDLIGQVALLLRFVDLKDNQVLMESAAIELESDDPLQVLNLAVQIPTFPLPQPGVYSFECYANESLIGSIRIMAKRREAQK